MRRYTAITPQSLAQRLIEELVERHTDSHPLRVALDAPGWVKLEPLTEALLAGLHALGRPVAVVRARDFYRDASLRFEHGRTDVESFYAGWLDLAGLQREVLRPLAVAGTYLPALRDEATNRAARAQPAPLPARGVLLVCGELLLGAGLSFDVGVHLALSRSARKRLAPEDRRWTLPAFDRYDIEVDPVGLADVVIRYDDPSHPAISVR
ncbi:MAG: uridine kinase [Jatrophihabitantaceae bacterium]